MRAVATLGNKRNVVAIDTYCDNLSLIATNVVVAIDRNPCSGMARRCTGLSCALMWSNEMYWAHVLYFWVEFSSSCYATVYCTIIICEVSRENKKGHDYDVNLRI
jgi:hypothetical protein